MLKINDTIYWLYLKMLVHFDGIVVICDRLYWKGRANGRPAPIYPQTLPEDELVAKYYIGDK